MASHGKLIVKTEGAYEAFPVADAIVRIRGMDEENKNSIFTVFTDEDGITKVVTLPAPDVVNSSGPYAPKPPFYNYDVLVSKDGFYSKLVRGVSVFPNILSTLTVNMIPFVPFSDGGRYPRENLVSESED